ncbi:MAG: alpha-N-arabinofuranosidase [Oscillospiraceae bacterium]|nr:alpha-N-arabinofuranosidase [Oscillospiraceae bacterium]
MKTAKIKIDKDFKIGAVDNRIYGSFVEHLGRCVYNGIYQPGHESADEEGFRGDVLELVKELNVPVVRYPGGNFVSGYNWEDGVGPPAERPKKRDLAWHVTESNAFGTNEFMSWAKKAGTEVMMAVNLGTRGADEARNFVEYCNHQAGTYYSDLRVRHGVKEPHNIKLWCLGNEMDGPWQIGHKTAYEYGRLACETARLMKWTDPSIELVACGSSGYGMPTFAAWEAEVLEQAYDLVDYIALHQYYGKLDASDTKTFMARTVELDDYINKTIAVCDYTAAKKKSKKKINISFDEWNVWWQKGDHEEKAAKNHYSVEEAVVSGGMLLSLLRRADRVKIGCQAQLVNVIAPIYTRNEGAAWRQTMFYPYMHASKYGRGTALITIAECDKYDCEWYSDVPVIDSIAVETENGVTIFVINRSEEEIILNCQLGGYSVNNPPEHISLWDKDKFAVNTFENPNRVVPEFQTDITGENNTITAKLNPLSWNVIKV